MKKIYLLNNKLEKWYNKPMKIQENVPISDLTTMRLGGTARYVIEIETENEVIEALDFANGKKLPIWVMGGGANTIGRDEGFDGVIFLNRIRGIFVEQNGTLIDAKNYDFSKLTNEIILTAMGGEVWDDFVELAANNGFSGCEAMSLIPGTVGAAPVQNIGAYGQDISQILESVTAFDLKTHKKVVMQKTDLEMNYRKTKLNKVENVGRYFITAVTVKLKRGSLKPPFYTSLQSYIDKNKITDFSPKNIRKMVCTIRNEKMPNPEFEASAGSFFKNVYVDEKGADTAEKKHIPVWKSEDGGGKINSGWLIEAAGLKGKLLHGFRISEKAALVLINESAKTYADLAAARKEIVDTVQEKFGYVLEQEPVELTYAEKH